VGFERKAVSAWIEIRYAEIGWRPGAHGDLNITIDGMDAEWSRDLEKVTP
jgi:hypothetical protein